MYHPNQPARRSRPRPFWIKKELRREREQQNGPREPPMQARRSYFLHAAASPARMQHAFLGPHTASVHGQLMQSSRAAEDSMRYEHVEPAHEAVRSRSLIESVRLHEHSQIHSHTTWPAQTLLFSMRKAASVLAGPSRR